LEKGQALAEFNKFYQDNETTQSILMKVKLDAGTNSDLYNEKYVEKMNNEIKTSLGDISAFNYDMMKVGTSIFLIIIMAVLITFSFIILLIALTVMRFAIVTHIEGNMKNIGSMEALGFTGRELILSTILQFVLITFVGMAIGFVIAASSIGLITNLVSSSIGLSWNAGVNFTVMGINLFAILALVCAISYMASAKLKKITPITALRSGVETHNFKRNFLPLSKSPLHINVSLGLKTFLQNTKQNIIILIIITLMSFVCVFTFTVNYNFNINNKALLRLVGIEKSELMTEYTGKDYQKYYDEIGKMEHVKKTLQLNQINMRIRFGDRNITPTVAICKDFNNLVIKTIVEGRYPVHDNEIAVTRLVQKNLNVKIGDVITLFGSEKEQEFIIVGITQQITSLGRGASITEDGMKRVNPYYTPTKLYIYLDGRENIPSVMKALEDRYSQSGFIINNIEDSFTTILASFNTAIIALCVACIIITIGIISLILFLLIKIKLLKEMVRIGVAKALGYTTGQLIIQAIISFCPVCILGAFIGAVTALFMIDPAFAAMLSVAGVGNSHFIMSPVLIFTIFLAVSAFSILITAIVARGIKRITPCELFVQ
jgi:putative ABC transport system permease protein